MLADSPGFNQPSLENVTLATLADCFPEVREKAERCACHISKTLARLDTRLCELAATA